MAYKKDTQKTPTSIFEIKLLVNKIQEKELFKYSDCARMHYNAVLGEALKRLNKVQKDPLYAETIKLSKTDKKQKSLRTANFKFLNEKYGFTKADLEKWGNKSKNNSKFIAEHVGAHVLQKLSNRAFAAVQKVAFGKAKKVHFYRKGEFITMEGKDNATYLRYSNGYAIIGEQVIPCKILKNDKHFEHMLNHRIKFCKLVCKEIKNKNVFYLQISYEGYPYKKISLGDKETGLDIGPSTIAIVNDSKASLEKFCAKIPDLYEDIANKKRKAAKKLLLANPKNYDEMGAVKKGCKNWTKSKQYLKLQREIRYLYYRLAAMRKQEHHILANQIVCESKIVKSEKISYKAFQKMYGKSIGKSAPSMFINILKKKLSLYGGTFIDIPTKTTKLSQTCICGQVKKKKLSTRHHKCDCGVNMQRDLFSAFLAIFVTKSGKLSIKKAKKNYPIYEPILNECLNKLRELKKNKPEAIISTFGI